MGGTSWRGTASVGFGSFADECRYQPKSGVPLVAEMASADLNVGWAIPDAALPRIVRLSHRSHAGPASRSEAIRP